MRIIFTGLLAIVFQATLAQEKTELMLKLLREYERQETLNGCVLAAEKGEILVEKAFGKANFEFDVPNTIETKFEIASISKHITAIILLQLRDEGKLSTDDLISKYLSDFPKEAADRITLKHLLTHTSGLTDPRFIRNYDETIGRQYFSRSAFVEFIGKHDLLFEPGTSWSYSNFGYNLLGIIIERIARKPYSEVLAERILIPAGMSNTSTLEQKEISPQLSCGYELEAYTEIVKGQYHDASQSVGSGSITTTVRDYYRYYMALIGGKLLSPASLIELTTPKEYTFHEDQSTIKWSYTLTSDSFINGQDSIPVMYVAGSHFGVHTAAYHFYDKQALVLVFLNLKTRPTKLFSIADNISNLLFNIPIDWPRDSYVRLFAKDLKQKGFEEAAKDLKSNFNANESKLDIGPRDLNRLGYFYLERQGQPQLAIKIFALNVEFFPDFADGFDSLGEAYFIAGNKELASRNLKRSLELNPQNEHAKELLAKLGE